MESPLKAEVLIKNSTKRWWTIEFVQRVLVERSCTVTQLKTFSQESNNKKLKQEEHDDNTQEVSTQIQAKSKQKQLFSKNSSEKLPFKLIYN